MRWATKGWKSDTKKKHLEEHLATDQGEVEADSHRSKVVQIFSTLQKMLQHIVKQFQNNPIQLGTVQSFNISSSKSHQLLSLLLSLHLQ